MVLRAGGKQNRGKNGGIRNLISDTALIQWVHSVTDTSTSGAMAML